MLKRVAGIRFYLSEPLGGSAITLKLPSAMYNSLQTQLGGDETTLLINCEVVLVRYFLPENRVAIARAYDNTERASHAAGSLVRYEAVRDIFYPAAIPLDITLGGALYAEEGIAIHNPVLM